MVDQELNKVAGNINWMRCFSKNSKFLRFLLYCMVSFFMALSIVVLE